jgi:hypothetical protein
LKKLQTSRIKQDWVDWTAESLKVKGKANVLATFCKSLSVCCRYNFDIKYSVYNAKI